jgi:hypothetical protein
MKHRQPIILTIVQGCLAILFFFFFWGQWGWGVACAIGVVYVATGIKGGRSSPIVPVPGIARIAIEILYVLLGVLASWNALGVWWGMLLLFVQCALLFLVVPRFREMART